MHFNFGLLSWGGCKVLAEAWVSDVTPERGNQSSTRTETERRRPAAVCPFREPSAPAAFTVHDATIP